MSIADTYYVMAQDDDGHWYVIPEDKQAQFSAWVLTNGDEPQPDWALRVGGAPSLVRFRNYDIR